MSRVNGHDASEGDVNSTDARFRYCRERTEHSSARGLLDRDSAAFLHQSLSTPCMNAIVGASGSRIIDAEGQSLLDFHGNSAHQIGYGHPAVIDAVVRQMREMPFCPRRYTNEPAIRLAEELGRLTGGILTKALLMPGGALAVGAAMKLARVATGRFKFLSMWGSFHGASLDAISIGGESVFRSGIGPLLPGCHLVHPCAPSSCAYGCRGRCEGIGAQAIEDVLRREGDIAAVIAEPIRCTTIDVPPADYWIRVKEACRRHGTLLVFDEIPIALGRTGRFFAYEHFGVTPDILVIGKGLGGGVIPQAAVLARADLDVAGHTALGHYTHEKSPVGSAAALATLRVISDEGLVQRSERLGVEWMRELQRDLAPLGVLGEVRGRGLLVGMELDAGEKRRTAELCEETLYQALRRGLSFKVSDSRVLTLTPPLTVSHDELDQARLILSESVAAALRIVS